MGAVLFIMARKMRSADSDAAARGFSAEEYAARAAAAQRKMAGQKLHALLLTSPADILYFSGFQTQFWQSPTRPWFLIIPADGEPIAVIPEIGEAAMAKTWVRDIRCWPSPRPEDEGISLLKDALAGGDIGMPTGAGTAARMPLSDWEKLRTALGAAKIADCAAMLQKQRSIKTAAEIARIRRAAQIASAAHAALPSEAAAGMSERDICRLLKISLLRRGADDLPYLAAASGAGGVQTVIAPPGDNIPANGDTLMIDTGAVFDDYFCDFNRNYAVGREDPQASRIGEKLYAALDAGIAAARPGNTAADVWRAMAAALPAASNIGRMGHGIGLQLTEPPSIAPGDNTPLQAGMTLAIEPSMPSASGRLMVVEENIVVGENGAEWLSHRAPSSPMLLSPPG